MKSMNIKFTINNFEYFLLTIKPKTELTNIINKLNNFWINAIVYLTIYDIEFVIWILFYYKFLN